MAAPSDGAPAQYLGGASAGFGAIIRLVESGTSFVAQYSTDGTATWNTIGTATPTFSSPLVFGLVSSSHDTGVVNTATFLSK